MSGTLLCDVRYRDSGLRAGHVQGHGKKKDRKRRSTSREGGREQGREGEDSEGEGGDLAHVISSRGYQVAKQAMTERARKKEQQRLQKQRLFYAVVVTAALAFSLWMAFTYDPLPEGSEARAGTSTPVGRPSFRPTSQPASYSRAPAPNVGEREQELTKKPITARVEISNSNDPDGLKMVLELHHTRDDPDGVDKDVLLFMRKYGVYENQREAVLNAAYQALQQQESKSKGVGRREVIDDHDMEEEREKEGEKDKGKEKKDVWFSISTYGDIPDPPKPLGTVKVANGQDEAFFPFYDHSDISSLVREAEEFVAKYRIPMTHVHKIVEIARKKQTNIKKKRAAGKK